MPETKELIEELGKKVESLINKLNSLGAEVDERDKQIAELQTQLGNQEAEVKKLQDENSGLKSNPVTVPIENDNDSEEVKGRIAELVKEIDTCISMLKV